MISHHHKTIFVHIPKCGGQSIEHAFIDDLNLTWENRAPLLLRQRAKGENAPHRLAHLLLRNYVENHYISSALYTEYFKFAVVRNPFHRLVSFYYYLGIDEKTGLNEFVENNLPAILQPRNPNFWFFRPQVDYLKNPAGLASVDAIYLLEELNQEWPQMAQRSGLGDAPLRHVNASVQSDRGEKQTLTDASRDIIRNLYHSDFAAFSQYE
jgi:hypothetical protein